MCWRIWRRNVFIKRLLQPVVIGLRVGSTLAERVEFISKYRILKMSSNNSSSGILQL